jgi:hypothetical protein
MIKNLKKIFQKKKPKNKDAVAYLSGTEASVSVPRTSESANASASGDLPNPSYQPPSTSPSSLELPRISGAPPPNPSPSTTAQLPQQSLSPPITLPSVVQNASPDTGSQTSATKPLPGHNQAEEVLTHQPPAMPPHHNVLSSVITDKPTAAVVGPSPNDPSAPIIAVSSSPPAQRPTPGSGSSSNQPAVSISTFGGAKDVTVHNSLINTVAGNQSIFKFDGSECTRLLTTHRFNSRFALGVPLSEDLRSMVRSSLRVSIR